MNIKITLIFCVVFGFAIFAQAASFVHMPSTLDSRGRATVEIDANGIERARVLQATISGIKLIEMQQAQGKFKTELIKDDLPVLKYQIQVQSSDGKTAESEYYVLEPSEQPSASAEQLAQLSKEQMMLLAKIEQTQLSLSNLRAANPASLAQRKGSELNRATAALGSKEREFAQELKKREDETSNIQNALATTDKGKKVFTAREELALESAQLFSLSGESR